MPKKKKKRGGWGIFFFFLTFESGTRWVLRHVDVVLNVLLETSWQVFPS